MASKAILVFTILFTLLCCSKSGDPDPFNEEPKEEAPRLTDEELLDLVQSQTFRYFWDFAHPTSGLIRERGRLSKGPTDVVTIGGTGFGLMTIIVAIERGIIGKEEGLDRLLQMVIFLNEKATRHYGAWPHWLNGETGETVPFSPNDDGGDLVETAFLFQGLLTVKQYFTDDSEKETQLRDLINKLWDSMEWDWYTQGGQEVLYWHWSPNFGWEKDHKITGWNEALIVYILAASSDKHGVEPSVYHNGWAKSGAMINNKEFYGHKLPLGKDLGGPLFFAHYSFLGLDPRNLKDQYANYWDQNVNHTLINRQYCIDNPKDFLGYHSQSWGLTASYSTNGYSAHSPKNDLGVITPTAALSSFPYTPNESMEMLRWLYESQKQFLWRDYGFIDAFSKTDNWYADGYLAIDQGPIIIMIENYRSGLLWDLFMSCPEIQQGLDKLGFTY